MVTLTSLQVKVDVAVKRLLQLKAEYKELTGEDLAGGGGKRGKKGGSKPPPAQPATKPATQPAQPAQPAAAPGAEDLKGRIDAQGVKVRGLKEGGATKVRRNFFHKLVEKFVANICKRYVYCIYFL